MIEHLYGLPVQIEHTPFRLSKHEMNVIMNNKFYQPGENHLSKTSFLLKDNRLIRVKNFLDERMKNYIENVVGVYDKFVMTQSWSTITKKGEQHHLHIHPNAIFSLVFYVSSKGKKSGNLVFDFHSSKLKKGWNFSYKIKRYNAFNSSTWEYEVYTGDLIIFPAWIHHFTRKNDTNNDRIVIGANYFIDGEVGSTEGVDKINIQLGDVHD